MTAGRCRSRVAACLFLLLIGNAPSSPAADVVHFSSAENADSRTRVTGEIIDLTGNELRMRVAGGERKFPADRVVEVEAVRTSEQVEGTALLAAAKYAEALTRFRAALAAGKEQRPWVRREIVTAIVRCYQALGQVVPAGDTFLNLLRSDLALRSFDCIPLVWLPATATNELQAAAEKWLKLDDQNPTVVTTARLIGASHLLSSPKRDLAVAELQRLAGNADPRIAGLAKAQLWNGRLATSTAADLRDWEKAVEPMPDAIRAGPYFVLGRALARQKQFDRAATMLLHVPILYPDHRELAARALVEAGACLEQLQQATEAVTLYQEVLDKHPESAATAEAQTRLQSLADAK